MPDTSSDRARRLRQLAGRTMDSRAADQLRAEARKHEDHTGQPSGE